MVVESSIEKIVFEELKSFKSDLNKAIKKDKIFSYLEVVAFKHEFPKDVLFDEALDLFNYYVKLGASSSRAKYLSVCRAHELVLNLVYDSK